MKILGYILTAVGCYLFMVAWQNVAKQDHIIRGSAPVEVRILDKRVKEHKSGDATVYSPSVIYSYTIGKNVYHSDRVLPIEQTRSDKQWAESIISGYEIDKTYTGYYDPEEHSKSFLSRRYTIAFYLPLFFYLAIFDLGLFAIVGAFGQVTREYKPDPNSAGWHKIEPQLDLPSQILTLQIGTGVWWFGTFLILGSYAAVAQPYLSNMFWVSLAGAAALGAYPTFSLFKVSKLAKAISNVTVLTNVSKSVHGQMQKIKITLYSESSCTLKSANATIICREMLNDNDGSQNKVLINKEVAKADAGTKIAPGQPFTLAFDFTPSSDFLPSAKKTDTVTEWIINLKVSTEDGGSFEERFPFVVHLDGKTSK